MGQDQTCQEEMALLKYENQCLRSALDLERKKSLEYQCCCAALDCEAQRSIHNLVVDNGIKVSGARQYALISLNDEEKRNRLTAEKLDLCIETITRHLHQTVMLTWFWATGLKLCLISLDAAAPEAVFFQEMEQALRRIYEEHNLRIWIAMSNWHPQHSQLAWLFHEAMAVHDSRYINENRISTFDMVRKSGGTYQVSELPDCERKLMNYVFQHEFCKAAEVFDRIMGIVLSESVMTLQIMVQTVHTRLNQVLNWLGLVLDPQAQPERYSSAFRELYQVEAFDDLKDCCHDFFAMLEDTIDESSYHHKAEAVSAYIYSNYQDPNLCAQQLCDHFLFSKSYLSRLMARELNSSLSDCIHEARVENAKKLLMNSDYSISEIEQRVGYTNRNTMHRAFVKITGMSPSEYRKHRRG